MIFYYKRVIWANDESYVTIRTDFIVNFPLLNSSYFGLSFEYFKRFINYRFQSASARRLAFSGNDYFIILILYVTTGSLGNLGAIDILAPQWIYLGAVNILACLYFLFFNNSKKLLKIQKVIQSPESSL